MFLPLTSSHLQVYTYTYICIISKLKSLHNIGYKNKRNLNYVEDI